MRRILPERVTRLGEERSHFRGGFEVRFPGASIGGIEGAATDAAQQRTHRVLLGPGVIDVVGRDQRRTQTPLQGEKPLVDAPVGLRPMVDELKKEVVRPEELAQRAAA